MARTGWLVLIAALLVVGIGVGEAPAARLELRRYSGIPRSITLPARGLWLPNIQLTHPPIPGGGGIGSCSFATSARCNPFSAGNTRFGRRDFVWTGDSRFPIDFGGGIGDRGAPARGIPEPGAALVFGLGLAAVAARVGRRRD